MSKKETENLIISISPLSVSTLYSKSQFLLSATTLQDYYIHFSFLLYYRREEGKDRGTDWQTQIKTRVTKLLRYTKSTMESNTYQPFTYLNMELYLYFIIYVFILFFMSIILMLISICKHNVALIFIFLFLHLF